MSEPRRSVNLPGLAIEDRWGLPGRVRGSLMAGWADNIRRRSGDGALRDVLATLGDRAHLVPLRPGARDWFPVGVQLAVTDAIVHVLLDGDRDAFFPLLLDDVRRSFGRTGLAVVRAAGPVRILRKSPVLFGSAYDVGVLTATLDARHAELRFRGAQLFADPTWRALQIDAWRVIHAVCDVPVRLWAADAPNGFDLTVGW